ncbi:MAG: MOSC domain-containing protein [Pseudomonadota bacterium]
MTRPCTDGPRGRVASVALSKRHAFSKDVVSAIELIGGIGVLGDAHAGETVKHRSRVRVDPTQPNLRQVHLIQDDLFEDLASKGFAIKPGDLGENITTSGVDLLALPRDSVLRIGDEAALKITGLRNPCQQIEDFREGLLGAVLERLEDGTIHRKAGVMAVVLNGGFVKPGDPISVEWPAKPHHPLERV